MNVNPGEEPSSGPNYYGFDPSVTYSIGIDNDRDGKADDVRFDVRFENEIRGFTKDLGLPLRYIGGGPLPVVDDVDDPGNGLRQTYEVTMNGKTLHQGSLARAPGQRRPADDPELRGQLPLGGRQDARRRDPRLRGPAGRPVLHRPRGGFDTLNLNPFVRGSGIDMLAGHNVHTIALEVPMAMISNGSGMIGAYGFTIAAEGHGPQRRRHPAGLGGCPASRCSASRTRSSTS